MGPEGKEGRQGVISSRVHEGSLQLGAPETAQVSSLRAVLIGARKLWH